MIDIEKLGFKYLDEIEFIVGPNDSEKGTAVMVVDEEGDINQIVVAIMKEFTCPYSAAIVFRTNQEDSTSFIFRNFVEGKIPNHIRDCKVVNLISPPEGGKNEDILSDFVELTNMYGFHHLLMLEEIDDNVFLPLYYDNGRICTIE